MNQYLRLLAINKGRGEFKAEKSAEEATVYLYDAIVNSEIEAEFFGGVDPKTFINELKSIDAPVINIRINSPGGSVFAARAMEQAMREHPSKIVAHIDGYAASAASFLMMAADEIVIGSGSMVMIHKAWTMAYGNSDDLIQTADLLEKIDSTLVDTYAVRSGADPKQISDWMAAETWFTAQEAVDAGFADRIAESKQKASAWDLSAYKNAPKNEQIEEEPEEILVAPVIDAAALIRRVEVAARI
jgi:ATP-dependent Clp protease protease subunit